MFVETFSAFRFENHQSLLDPIRENSSDNIECFLEYMELWVPRRQIDGLVIWLSQIMRFPVSLISLDRSNKQLSRCKYFLDADEDGNFLFRVHYTGCYVQMQKGFHKLEIHMVKKTSSGRGQSNRYLMKCPAMTAQLGREKVRCDPSYVQVSRPIPLGNDQADWFLSLRGELVVSMEDASLIGIEVEMSNSIMTVSGLREQLLDGIKILDRQTDDLHLWLAHGFYAYSLEASCPTVSQHPGEEVILHIPKQRVGLVKRGSYITEILTLKNIIVGQSANVTVIENKQFVVINIPSKEVLKRKDCYSTIGNYRGVQFFYCIDLMLEFTEMAYPFNWTLENYYECTVTGSQMIQSKHVAAEIFHKDNLDIFLNNSELHTTPRPETRTARLIKPTQYTTLAIMGNSSVHPHVTVHVNNHVNHANMPSPMLLESSKTEMTASGHGAELDNVASGEYFNILEGSGYYTDTNISGALLLLKKVSSHIQASVEVTNNSTSKSNLTSENLENNRTLTLTEKQISVPSVPSESYQNLSNIELVMLNEDKYDDKIPQINQTTNFVKDTTNMLSRETYTSNISAVLTSQNVAGSGTSFDFINKNVEPLNKESKSPSPVVVMSSSLHWSVDDTTSLEILPPDTDETSNDGFIPVISRNAVSNKYKKINENNDSSQVKYTMEQEEKQVK
ncbi:uncharacterized protein c1orf127.L isoform X2 [Xenopus laevis]|nr:uncharacterized protein c1orf127.L isoform X2 [Xenopus laevis]